jgi:hypothetical protein
MEKVHISSSNTATFVCPNCENTSTVDVTKYAKVEKRVTVKVKCRCGHNFTVVLEKRKKYRKPTNLPGTYTLLDGDGDKGVMTVMDISSSGLKLRLNVGRNFDVGDRLKVEFKLDDKRRTRIDKNVVVQNVSDNYVGVVFAPGQPDDPALGFYLLN